MEKNILSEINRNREIMGLGQLLREEVSAESIKLWMNSDGADASPSIRELIKKLTKFNLINTKINGGTIWAALNTAFNKITGKDIVDDNGDGTKAAFAGGQWGTGMGTMGDKVGKAARILPLLDDGTTRIVSKELKLSKDTPISPAELISRINEFNINNAGDEQLVRLSPFGIYKEYGNSTRVISKKNKNTVFLWSLDRTTTTRNATKDTKVPGQDIAGDVLMTGLGDNYQDLQIVVSDDSKVVEIKTKMESHVKQGGTIDSIVITSTASNTGLDTDKMTDFSNMMKKEGMGDYVNVSTDKGTTGDFTIDQVDTTDRALAVARGKILAKQLGVESNVTYKFSITDGPKTVNISVKGTSPDKEGEDVNVKGSVEDGISSKQEGDNTQIRPRIMWTQIKKRRFGGKISDALGTSTGSKRLNKS